MKRFDNEGGGRYHRNLRVGGFHPNYEKLIHADPAYVSYLGNLRSGMSNLSGDRATTLRNLILQFGGLPPGFKDQYGDLRPGDLANAQNNPLSEEAQIQQAFQRGIQSLHGNLAARGMLQSGELGYGTGVQEQNRTANESSARQSLLASITNALQGYTSGVSGLQGQEAGIISQIEQTHQGDPTWTPKEGHAAHWDAALSARYGKNIWVDKAGVRWTTDAQGNPVKVHR